MERRQLLITSTAIGGTLIAGCVNLTGENDVQDSDGDGVIDSEDYAPHDPDVQTKSDLEDVSSSINQTRTDTDSDDSNTEDSDTNDGTTEDGDPDGDSEKDDSDKNGDSESENVPDINDRDSDSEGENDSDAKEVSETEPDEPEISPSEANTFRVDDGEFEGDSHISAYSSQEVTAIVDPTDPEISGRNLLNYDIQVITTGYPREEIITESVNRSNLNTDSPTTVTISIDMSDARQDDPLQYILFLVPEDETIETADVADIVHLHETDPFILTDDGVTIDRTVVPELEGLGDDAGRGHERVAKEGVFELSFTGRTEGRNWNVSFYIFKSAYVEAVRRDHGRSRPQFVDYEMSDGFGWELARLLESEAEYNGFTDKRMQVEFVIDFVQHLPYVPDDVSKGYDDYTKFTMETTTECGGDCEDTAILLVSVLQADPFGYDLVLIQPPGHMAAGIKGADDLPGYYWEYDGNKYYYIETTGVGWGIGNLPDEYKNESARVHQV